MIKFALQKMRAAYLINTFKQKDDTLITIFCIFIFGVFFGNMASSSLFADSVGSSHSLECVEINVFCLLLVVLFSTSYLGCIFIPILLCLRAFIFSAVFSSVYSFSSSGGIWNAVVAEAFPMALFLPALLLIADDCIKYSSSLFKLRFGQTGGVRKTSFFRHLFFCIASLALGYLYDLYLMPLMLV